ncbi:MAG TPA: DUF6166 domain-containing protein [Verrucomicrobiae bacterium]|nr:DUF6166 domain-containing protein [Verrucomicrobiae bacterium]
MAYFKVYRGTRRNGQALVTVDNHPLEVSKHVSDNRIIQFDWGNEGAGAERLARSILSDCLGAAHSSLLARQFVESVVSKLKSEWEILSKDVEDWSSFTCHVEASALRAAWSPGTAASAVPPTTLNMPDDLPQLIRNPNYRLFPHQ